jgi:hypothetical protein
MTPSLSATAIWSCRAQLKRRIVISSGGDAAVLDSVDGKHSIFTATLLDVVAIPAMTSRTCSRSSRASASA